jgi:CubicO group peptidase (beta-lactamase class C family)
MQPASAGSPADLGDLADSVRRVLGDWQIPGAALAVARAGEVVLTRCFGWRDTAGGLPVTPRTLFAIGSSTKAFSTLALGLLADEGRLDWDAPVRSYLPAFALRDPVASERLTPRDLATHRSGLPRHDLLWYGSPCSREEPVERLRYLAASKDFRAAWQYQNLLYMLAGYLAGHLAGYAWEELVQRRIFDPLGMVASNCSVVRSRGSEDYARPHRAVGGRVVEMPFRDNDAMAPAGGINSTIGEMGNWLLLHLGRGRHRTERLISEGQVAQMHAPQVVVPGPGT